MQAGGPGEFYGTARMCCVLWVCSRVPLRGEEIALPLQTAIRQSAMYFVCNDTCIIINYARLTDVDLPHCLMQLSLTSLTAWPAGAAR